MLRNIGKGTAWRITARRQSPEKSTAVEELKVVTPSEGKRPEWIAMRPLPPLPKESAIDFSEINHKYEEIGDKIHSKGYRQRF